MNYSASEYYWDRCKHFDKKSIHKNDIKRRWFRNWYVLHQSKRYFTHNTFVLEAEKFDPFSYDGEYFGPFYKETTARKFAAALKSTHEDFIMGG